MPPVKLVERGRLREDVLRWILNQVRDPLVGLDVRGQVAALATGRRRLLELVAAWGVDTVTGVMERSIELAREKLARRLGELPDGVWREVQFIDHDGHAPEIYRIVCTMTKRGDRLTFDFTGTSPNARGLINCTYSGLQAAVLSAVYINLCWDTPWNRGVRDCIDIVSESGTVNNCTYPAPCAMATISAVIVTIDAAWRCLAQLLLASDKYSEQAMAVWSGTSLAPIFAGTSQHGFPFAATEMSHFGGGGGARTYADGVDTAGIVFNTTPNMPNIEDQEAEYPVLYLFRRHLRDSGGPGRFRGGRAGELAYTVYGAPEGRLEGLFAGTGAEMPNAIGLARAGTRPCRASTNARRSRPATCGTTVGRPAAATATRWRAIPSASPKTWRAAPCRRRWRTTFTASCSTATANRTRPPPSIGGPPSARGGWHRRRGRRRAGPRSPSQAVAGTPSAMPCSSISTWAPCCAAIVAIGTARPATTCSTTCARSRHRSWQAGRCVERITIAAASVCASWSAAIAEGWST
jgi:hypothetical protein